MIYFILAAFALGIILNYTYTRAKVVKDYANTYLIWFGLPLLIFLSLVRNKGNIADFGFFIVISSVFLLIINLVHFYVVRKVKISEKKKASLFLTTTYPNTAFLGIPILTFFFQETGALLAATFTIVTLIFHFSLGVYFSNRYLKKSRSALSEVIKFPLLWGTVIALVLSFFVQSAPEWIFLFSKSAIYLAPFVVGLAFKIGKIEGTYIYGFALKFLVMPALLFAFLFLFALPAPQKLALLLLAALPPGLTSTMLAIKYRFDEEYAASFTSYSTLIFLVIILIVSLLS